jgi:enoyl-CoA hydratase/carnithine racemase
MADLVVTERVPVPADPPGREIAWVSINRPFARNALTRGTMQELRRVTEKAALDPNVRVIVLTGQGKGDQAAFCAGADLRTGMSEDPDMFEKLDFYLDDFHGFIRLLWNAPKPVIARIDGGAVGFGCDLALACDLRIGSERAYFQSSFSKIGLVPDGGGTGTLARLVGLGVASEMIFLASKIEAQRAKELGLLTRVVPSDELDAATADLARQLAGGPPIAFAEAKRSMHQAMGITIDEILAREREAQLRCLRSQDAIEGVMAWTQKRPPQFQGK